MARKVTRSRVTQLSYRTGVNRARPQSRLVWISIQLATSMNSSL